MARLLGNPAACHGHITHLPAQAGGVSPMESRSITLLRQNAPPGSAGSFTPQGEKR
ncbi:MAG: hypothetical protein O6918_04265 [Deltaproteobacteria bacterium]|nr:hypothetical protein [Deltaproteobacteria bacterium]